VLVCAPCTVLVVCVVCRVWRGFTPFTVPNSLLAYYKMCESMILRKKNEDKDVDEEPEVYAMETDGEAEELGNASLPFQMEVKS
jgi:hypothetical protein